MRRLRSGLAIVLASAVLAACATGPRPSPPAAVHTPTEPAPPSPRGAPARQLSFADLPGWGSEDHAAALRAFQAGCGAARDRDSVQLCRRARALGGADEREARRFFETSFRPQAVGGQGLLTAYFQPEYEARTAPEGEFTAPVRPRPASARPEATSAPGGPDDPLTAQLSSLFDRPVAPAIDADADRAAIEAAPLDGPALAWMRPEDLFFMQIQGSGVLDLPGGRRLRAVFAASNGKPFVGIARVMREEGLLADRDTSQSAIHAWLAAHRGPEADAVMRRNPRYIFFKVERDDGEEPAGAAGVPLPAGRALAMDPSRHAMGELYWIDAEAPALAGAFPAYRRLAVALDVGGAIKGEVRADLYLGRGDAAGREAGRVRHVLKLYRLVPRDPDQVAARP